MPTTDLGAYKGLPATACAGGLNAAIPCPNRAVVRLHYSEHRFNYVVPLCGECAAEWRSPFV